MKSKYIFSEHVYNYEDLNIMISVIQEEIKPLCKKIELLEKEISLLKGNQ
jgi:hypothetical protein